MQQKSTYISYLLKFFFPSRLYHGGCWFDSFPVNAVSNWKLIGRTPWYFVLYWKYKKYKNSKYCVFSF